MSSSVSSKQMSSVPFRSDNLQFYILPTESGKRTCCMMGNDVSHLAEESPGRLTCHQSCERYFWTVPWSSSHPETRQTQRHTHSLVWIHTVWSKERQKKKENRFIFKGPIVCFYVFLLHLFLDFFFLTKILSKKFALIKTKVLLKIPYQDKFTHSLTHQSFLAE